MELGESFTKTAASRELPGESATISIGAWLVHCKFHPSNDIESRSTARQRLLHQSQLHRPQRTPSCSLQHPTTASFVLYTWTGPYSNQQAHGAPSPSSPPSIPYDVRHRSHHQTRQVCFPLVAPPKYQPLCLLFDARLTSRILKITLPPLTQTRPGLGRATPALARPSSLHTVPIRRQQRPEGSETAAGKATPEAPSHTRQPLCLHPTAKPIQKTFATSI